MQEGFELLASGKTCLKPLYCFIQDYHGMTSKSILSTFTEHGSIHFRSECISLLVGTNTAEQLIIYHILHTAIWNSGM